MPENWKTYKLSEAFEIIGGGTPKTKIEEYWNGDIPWLSVVDFNNDNRTVNSTEKSISELGLKKSSTKILSRGQLIISARGTVGQIAQLGRDMAFNQSCYGLSGKENILINNYGFYLLKSSITNIQSNSHGSVFDTITRNTFENIEVSIPCIQEQKSIASILSALDDKIELNLQMNKTLEEMAMALYKHWFVDFGPFQSGEFVATELGEIPKGWEVKPIGEVIETLGGGTPKTKISEYWEKGTIDWYSPTDLTKSNSLFSLGTAKKITEKGLAKSSAKIFPKNSLLMSSRATIGAITINRNEACTNQGFITMIPNKTLSLYQLHGWTVHNMNLIISKANGSTFKEISKTNFRNLPIVVGNEIDEYKIEAKNYYDQIENNILENQTLTKLRDTLLPKLISGEVRVKDAEKTLSEIL
mgnify:CR=1 FL=1|tara:strand:- start:15295 stop:16539 length:1245 start_codon:yes stop_codon:yes gene_type:complete